MIQSTVESHRKKYHSINIRKKYKLHIDVFFFLLDVTLSAIINFFTSIPFILILLTFYHNYL